MIFSIQHIASPGYGSTMQLFCGTRSVYRQGWNHYMVAPHTVDRYENLDGSKFNWDDIIPGYNAMIPEAREVFFLRDTIGLEDKLQEWGFSNDPAVLETEARAISKMVKDRLEAIADNKETAGAEKFYLPEGNEARIKKAYENRDPVYRLM
ncbi:MAG: hypothetical protein LUE93_14935 [Bacteroides sp.]|nr:hypothetical protein [Bacteroides sp.]